MGKTKSMAERLFLEMWKQHAGDVPQPEVGYRFSDTRDYEVDFAWKDERVAVEIEGGIFTRQAHGSVSGMLRDIEKYNLAAVLNWRVYRIVPSQFKKTPMRFIEDVMEMIGC